MRKLMLNASAALIALSAPSVAQTSLTPVVPALGCTQPYYVQKGDNLWALADLRLQNPERWHWLVDQNPILKEPRRYTNHNGKEIVLIRPGEVLYCLDEAGISLTSTGSANVGYGKAITTTTSRPEKSFTEKLGDWLGSNWWLLLLIIPFLLWLWLRRETRKDAAEAGPAQVRGGIDNVAEAEQRFADRGARQHFTILHTVGGEISGTMMVSYANGTRRPRTLDRQRAYRATVRHENGQVEDLYMLQACGNDLRYGGISRYLPGPDFRFVEDVPVAATEQLPIAEVAAPAAVPTVEEVTLPVALAEPGAELKIELKPAENPGDTAMVRVTGAPTSDMVLIVSEDSFTLRFHPKS